MRLTKRQLETMDQLNNGGFIWEAGESKFLACVVGYNEQSKQPRFESKRISKKTFEVLKGFLTKKDERWTIG